jgi:hypothetical protein
VNHFLAEPIGRFVIHRIPFASVVDFGGHMANECRKVWRDGLSVLGMHSCEFNADDAARDRTVREEAISNRGGICAEQMNVWKELVRSVSLVKTRDLFRCP